MSVTTKNYTSSGNSVIVQITAETTSTNVIGAVNTALTTLGWTQYDSVAATTYSPVVTYVYRVLNADGITYKYLIVRWDTIKLFFYTSTCESWNFATHVPTNESWTQAGGFAQGYDLINSYIIISATSRHAMLWPFINNQPGLWTAVVEFERVAAEDTAALATPCYAWTNSLIAGTPWGQASNQTGQGNVSFAFPRLADGTVGPQAAYYMNPVTNKGIMPPSCPWSQITIGGDNNFGHLGSYYKNLVYEWDTTQFSNSPISVDHRLKLMPFGRAYNLGVTARVTGAPGDTLYTTVNTTGGWPANVSNFTSNVECLTLPITGGSEANVQNTPLSLYGPTTGYSYTAYKSNATAATTNIPGKVIAIGDTLWMATAEGVKTVSQTGGQNTLAIPRVVNTSGIVDIVYDGQRTVYGSAANGIVKVDTITYAYSYATSADTIANGCGYLGIDNKNVYASNLVGNTAPSCIVLDRATFTIGTANTFVHTGTLTSAATNYGTPVPDYNGNVFLATMPGVATATQTYIGQFVALGGSGTCAVNPSRGAVTAYGGDAFWYDYITRRLWLVSATPTNNTYLQQELYPGNLQVAGGPANLPIGTTATTTNMSTNLGLNGSLNYKGDLNIIPFRGMHFIQPKQPGINIGAWCPGIFTTFIHPAVANTYPSGQYISGIQNTAASFSLYISPFYNSGGLTTNGSQLLASGQSNGVYTSAFAINGVYTTTSTTGQPLSRLLLKS